MPYTDHFTRGDFSLIAGTRACYRRTSRSPDARNYESHQPCTYALFCADKIPFGRYEISFGDYQADLRTARYSYALKVLEVAHARTLEKYPDWLDHEWVIEEPGWRQVHFKSPQRHQAEEHCDSLVREIADSGEIVLRESLTISPAKECKQLLLLIRNIPKFDKAALDAIIHGIKNGIEPSIGRADLKFGYEEIACHIVRMDERMLSLLNAEDAPMPLNARALGIIPR